MNGAEYLLAGRNLERADLLARADTGTGPKIDIGADPALRPKADATKSPIHARVEFWSWFGGSRIVDAKGRPVPLAVGGVKVPPSAAAPNVLAISKRHTEEGGYCLGTRPAATLDAIAGSLGVPAAPVVRDVFVKMDRPFVIDKARGINGGAISIQLEAAECVDLARQLKRDGYDGILWNADGVFVRAHVAEISQLRLRAPGAGRLVDVDTIDPLAFIVPYAF